MVERPLCMREVLGSAPALHAGGTGIDARILHTKSASYFTAHDPDCGGLRRTQIATVVSNRTAFATRDDKFYTAVW